MSEENSNLLKYPRSIGVWVVVNTKGEMQMFVDRPIKENGQWKGTYYINSSVRNTIWPLIEKSSMGPGSEPEYMELSLKK